MVFGVTEHYSVYFQIKTCISQSALTLCKIVINKLTKSLEGYLEIDILKQVPSIDFNLNRNQQRL